MLAVATAAELVSHVGAELGPSEWLTITQTMIDQFAEATGDHQWIHVDVQRAAAEMPDGKTIAHGYLLLSCLPRLAIPLLQIRAKTRTLNYGSDRVRYTATVASGSRVRLRQTIKQVELTVIGTKLVMENTLELEGSKRPALVAETIQLAME
jgi:acyl dehydratase